MGGAGGGLELFDGPLVDTVGLAVAPNVRGQNQLVAFVDDVANGLADEVSITKLREYFDHPGFVAPFVEGARTALARIDDERPGARTHVLFVTHSIPTAAASASGPSFGPGGAYVAQHLAVARAVLGEAAPAGTPWSLVYQSRSGSPSVPWLEPQ